MTRINFTRNLAFFSLAAGGCLVAVALALGGHESVAQSAGAERPPLGLEREGAGNTVFVMPRSGPFAPDTIAIPNARVIAAWARSGHSDASSESFTHWNAEGEIPPACATCHSGAGFRDFHGLDGSEPGPLTSPIPVGGVVDCDTCHSPNLSSVTQITLSSGVVHPVSGADASCVTCHQGRADGGRVGAAIADKPLDEPNADLRFINPHYAIAAATNLGGYAALGYHYPDKSYSGRFLHAKPVATCVSCHDPHTLDIAESTCLTCHEDGAPENIRIARVSYDGSGDTTKGISHDLDANAGRLLQMVKDYADSVAGMPIVYDGQRYPYFFNDANRDGLPDMTGDRPAAYDAWTPRLLRAVYNWKFTTADAGAYAHNPPYAFELLYDSMEDLAGPLGLDMGTLGPLR